MGKSTERERAEEEVRTDPPGPKDHGREGGMATRENAPEAVKRSGEDSSDD
ncbi:hypothetical protein IA539_00835 [Gordonia sp. zg691]|uniref:Uncharacterized protein n=1 Tax=Gordonia jinghuaiqii TaxID=2758710 RepID=A0A7D7LWH8_9ACTN|nr:hypothetical protein [Gordonia jinghuaiqii]MBD0859762.1 hypothetical protein [Gordonia jinghuaiqii]QMT00394.1 hypothetical protein H1R19_15925 [Gordonia jinghuaiqii]